MEWPICCTSSWVKRSGSPDCDPQLLGDEVEVGDLLGDAVLDLEAGVHLEEEELAVLVEALDGAGADVAAAACHLSPRLAHRGADLVDVIRGGGRLLDQLLVAALGGTVALAHAHHVAVGVGEDLQLDVAGRVRSRSR